MAAAPGELVGGSVPLQVWVGMCGVPPARGRHFLQGLNRVPDLCNHITTYIIYNNFTSFNAGSRVGESSGYIFWARNLNRRQNRTAFAKG